MVGLAKMAFNFCVDCRYRDWVDACDEQKNTRVRRLTQAMTEETTCGGSDWDFTWSSWGNKNGLNTLRCESDINY